MLNDYIVYNVSLSQNYISGLIKDASRKTIREQMEEDYNYDPYCGNEDDAREMGQNDGETYAARGFLDNLDIPYTIED